MSIRIHHFALIVLAALSFGAQAEDAGYLAPAQMPNIKLWLSTAPAKGSAADAADVEVFKATRAVLHTARGQMAAEDDVYDAPQVITRFNEALGVALTPANAPVLLKLLKKAQSDGANAVAPMKLALSDGGRVRPFVAYPGSDTCLEPVDMAGRRHNDVDVFHIEKTGSYPSTHALTGMIFAMVLSEVAPERSDAVTARGMEFGRSRVVCGFHYESDVTAGRLVAAVVFARLQADPAFAGDMAQAIKEVQAARH